MALSDPLGIIAKPLKIIDSKATPDYISEIQNTVLDKDVKAIVVGVPLTLKGGQSQQTKIVNQFIAELSDSSNIPVYGIDERLSTIAAVKIVQEQGVKTGHEKGRVDEVAASIILQEYLDSR